MSDIPRASCPLPPVPSARRRRDLLAVTGLVLIALAATASIACSVLLRAHDAGRRDTLDELAGIERCATNQATLVWRGVTLQLVEDRLGFTRLRGEEQRGRGEVLEALARVRELQDAGARVNRWLGLAPGTDELEALEGATQGFLADVQGVFGQMTLDVGRVRDRLRYWDMSFGQFQEALTAVRAHARGVALASSQVSNQVAAGAALLTLVAATLLVLRLSHVRARQASDLQRERIRVLASSEARFRALVQQSSDLILVLEPDGRVRYATPTARVLASSANVVSQTSCADLEDVAEEAAEVVRALEASIATGALHDAEVSVDRLTCAVHEVLGWTAGELLENVRTEVVVPTADGGTCVLDVHATDLRADPDVGGIVLNARDVTERKDLEERLRHQALHDPLTGLPNRRSFRLHFDELTDEQRRASAVLFLDLDGFKRVNDSYGHAMGDELLVAAAQRIATCLGARDVLARQGGDEFLLLVSGGEGLCGRILSALQPPFLLDGKEVFVSASIGVLNDLCGLDAEVAAQRADIAMYAAKQAGKARAVVFDDAMLAGAPERLRLEADFRRALERGEFTVHYQPKVGFASGRIESLEALVRWLHPVRGFVSPETFIPFAEETGLISELGRMVLEQACRDAVRWQDRGVVVAVNLSPVQFRNPGLIEEIRAVLDETGLAARFLELEITESAVLGDVDTTVRMLKDLKALGVRLAIDDFGTGYSNLSHLKHFDVDVLKIDQAFVRGGSPGCLDQLSDGAIVEAVIAMAKAFGLHVVAEGVESQVHADVLRALGADLGQGYFFSKPVAGDQIDVLLGVSPAGLSA